MALLFACLLAPLWLFVELADEVHELEAFFFDDALLLRARSMATPGLDRFFVFLSAIGYQWGVVPADVALSLALLALRRWREASFAIVSFTGSALLNIATKQFFQRERPSLWESIAPEHTFSFPSGHAMGSMTLAMVVALLAWNTRWRWPVAALAAAFALLVGVSRIYLGVHYPSDILGGWAAGMAWVAGIYLLLYRDRWRLR
ncbi:phosphatase PAP2 family protein [Pseudoxanthomonas mexicana]|uniref:phosphatase PAP2 family protein n=1 Tax=Pseudoxanthomonas mexicana TaxID=128785 RepID=UPI00398AD92F